MAVLVWLYVCLGGFIYMRCPVAYNPIKQKEFSSFETSAFTFMHPELTCKYCAPALIIGQCERYMSLSNKGNCVFSCLEERATHAGSYSILTAGHVTQAHP